MYIKIKYNYIKILCVILILFCFLFSCFILEGEKINAEPTLKNRIIVIDPGHGGLDGGAVAKDGTSEKNINLNISLYLKDLLEKSGCKVIMTRKTDVSLHNDENSSVKEKKRSDLINRRNLANSSNADLLISIHLNYFQQEKYSGAQVFFERNHKESEIIASILQQALIEKLDKENKRVAHKLDSKKILFEELKIPGVIVECGFLSNIEESRKLKDKNYQKKVAQAIYTGICNYFLENNIY